MGHKNLCKVCYEPIKNPKIGLCRGCCFKFKYKPKEFSDVPSDRELRKIKLENLINT